ncbi:hypothetical protein CTZ27_03065 [Streptomyces griseocarneus]|nr:hypothetical protein CTZ27_03065 [Streptomyces griseocarneus]
MRERQLPSDFELRQALQLGASNPELAGAAGVSGAAVSFHRGRLGMPFRLIATRVTQTFNDSLNVLTGGSGETHHNNYVFQGLKYWMRLRLGDTDLSPRQEEQADRLVSRLLRKNKVITYNRNSERGFSVVDRMPEDGNLMVRWPVGVPLPEEDLVRAMTLPDPGEDG